METNPARPDHVLVIHWLLMDTNMTKDEALQMCLEYIETDAHERKYVRHAIKAALEAKDEPERCTPNCEALLQKVVTQRKPLTDEEIQKCYETTGHYQTLRPQDRFAVFALARAIEAAHGIKGEA